MTTFNLTNKDPNGHLFRFAAEAYRFAESPDLFKDYVQNLIDHHKYAAAAQVAQWTGQSREEYLYGFLVPLAFSRNQANVLYDYLEAQPALLVDIVQLLDSLMSNAAQSCRQLMAKYNYRNIPQESLTEEYLRKNIPKIRKKFNLSTDATPNTAFQQNIKALTFWIRKFALGEAGEKEWKLFSLFLFFREVILGGCRRNIFESKDTILNMIFMWKENAICGLSS